MAERRGPGVVSQRTLTIESAPTVPEPPALAPEQPALPPPGEPRVAHPPPTYGPIVASGDALWERRARWLKVREQLKEARRTESPPPARE